MELSRDPNELAEMTAGEVTDTALLVEGLRPAVGGPYDLALAGGECVTLSGPSGSGKTLLLRAIVDLDPNAGEIFLAGRARHSFSPAAWRRAVGFLPSESAWWGERVGEHFPRVERSILGRLGFQEEVLGWPVRRLSAGERQRLALARLLGNQPQVLLLDEPTAHLDPDATARVERTMMDWLGDGRGSILWVSHDDRQASRVAARRLRLEGGCLSRSEGE